MSNTFLHLRHVIIASDRIKGFLHLQRLFEKKNQSMSAYPNNQLSYLSTIGLLISDATLRFSTDCVYLVALFE